MTANAAGVVQPSSKGNWRSNGGGSGHRGGSKGGYRGRGGHGGGGGRRQNFVGSSREDARWNPIITELNTRRPVPESAICAATQGHYAWSHTVTYQFDVVVVHTHYTVRAHVHYTPRAGGGHDRGPGNCWVSGIDDHSIQTPAWIVNAAPAAVPNVGAWTTGWDSQAPAIANEVAQAVPDLSAVADLIGLLAT